MSDSLTARLKLMIVETLGLDYVVPEDIPDDEPLLGSPRLGLDSIDALELVVRFEKEFGIKIGSSEESRRALTSITALAAYIRSHPASRLAVEESMIAMTELMPGERRPAEM